METSKRRVGRPKGSLQTGPLVLSEKRNRAKIEIHLGAEAAQDLADYVRWVETTEGMSTVDAIAATVEFALRNVFKRDRLWQDWRRKGEPDRAAAPGATRPAPAATSPSLPTPALARGATSPLPSPTR